MKKDRIKTSYVHPPIPIRDFDWVAWIDGEEDGFRGHGKTEQQARGELLNELAEHDPDFVSGESDNKPMFDRRPPWGFRNRQA